MSKAKAPCTQEVPQINANLYALIQKVYQLQNDVHAFCQMPEGDYMTHLGHVRQIEDHLNAAVSVMTEGIISDILDSAHDSVSDDNPNFAGDEPGE